MEKYLQVEEEQSLRVIIRDTTPDDDFPCQSEIQ